MLSPRDVHCLAILAADGAGAACRWTLIQWKRSGGRTQLGRGVMAGFRIEFFKAEKGRYLHPDEDRAITHYEAALLQGFGEGHRFVGSRTDIARQIGNAAPVPVGAAIGRLLAEVL